MQRSIAITALLASNVAFGCFSPPADVRRDHASIINEASSIVLVRASLVPDKNGECLLEIVEVLKGDSSLIIPLTCRLPDSGDWMTDFSGHSHDSFWDGKMGRLGVESDCSVTPPAYRPDKTYLVFVGIQPDSKQYEEISGKDDEWFRFVISSVHGQ